MQIDRLNHLLFPPDSTAVSTSKDANPAAAGAPGHARTKLPTVVARVEPPAAGVVLKIHNPSAAPVPTGADDSPVYSDQRKSAAPASEAAEAEHMAQGHQLALERNAGVITRMSVDKDGVLVVAKPHTTATTAATTAGDSAPTDFVTMAVNAMRDFSNEAARQKAGTGDGQAGGAEGKLKGLQHLAARFKLFA